MGVLAWTLSLLGGDLKLKEAVREFCIEKEFPN